MKDLILELKRIAINIDSNIDNDICVTAENAAQKLTQIQELLDQIDESLKRNNSIPLSVVKARKKLK